MVINFRGNLKLVSVVKDEDVQRTSVVDINGFRALFMGFEAFSTKGS